MCARDFNFEDLNTIHHELGHIQYDQQYKELPVVFRFAIGPKSCMIWLYFEFSSTAEMELTMDSTKPLENLWQWQERPRNIYTP